MKTSKAISIFLLITICTLLLVGCVNNTDDNTVPELQPDTNSTIKPEEPTTKPDDTKLELKRASRIHILNSQTFQHEYNATSDDTWGLITLLNCTYSISNGMIKISGSLGKYYATVETSVQNVLIVY